MRSLKIWKSDTVPTKGSKSLCASLSDNFSSQEVYARDSISRKFAPIDTIFYAPPCRHVIKKYYFTAQETSSRPYRSHTYANTYTKNTYNHLHGEHASYNRSYNSLAHSYTQKHMPLSNKISLIIHALAQNMLNARRRCVETLQEIYVCVCVFVCEYYCILYT